MVYSRGNDEMASQVASHPRYLSPELISLERSAQVRFVHGGGQRSAVALPRSQQAGVAHARRVPTHPNEALKSRLANHKQACGSQYRRHLRSTLLTCCKPAP